MSDLNPKAGNTTANLRKSWRSLLFLAILLIFSIRAGLAQTSLGNKSTIMSGDGSVAAQRETLDYLTNTGGGEFDSTIAERRMKMLNNERHKSLISDSDKLFKLATEINNEIAQSNSGLLTPEQLRKVAEIEKLARSVRDKMTQTLPPPSANIFPISGAPFNQ